MVYPRSTSLLRIHHPPHFDKKHIYRERKIILGMKPSSTAAPAIVQAAQSNKVLEAALAYRRLGMSVLPLKGKRPALELLVEIPDNHSHGKGNRRMAPRRPAGERRHRVRRGFRQSGRARLRRAGRVWRFCRAVPAAGADLHRGDGQRQRQARLPVRREAPGHRQGDGDRLRQRRAARKRQPGRRPAVDPSRHRQALHRREAARHPARARPRRRGRSGSSRCKRRAGRSRPRGGHRARCPPMAASTRRSSTPSPRSCASANTASAASGSTARASTRSATRTATAIPASG